MKNIIIGLACVLVVTSVIPVVAKGKPTKPTYLTNEDKLYQFQRPSKTWRKKEAGGFNDYWFVHRDASCIFIGSRTYTVSQEEFDLFTVQHGWIKGMQKKYNWKSVKIVEEEEDFAIDGHSAVWSVIECKDRGRSRKEKIYIVQGDKLYYRLRLSCPKRYFDKHLPEFEHLVNSFKLL